jgi:hypothetical protein
MEILHPKAPNFHQIHGVPDPARSELNQFPPVRHLKCVRFYYSVSAANSLIMVPGFLETPEGKPFSYIHIMKKNNLAGIEIWIDL